MVPVRSSLVVSYLTSIA